MLIVGFGAKFSKSKGAPIAPSVPSPPRDDRAAEELDLDFGEFDDKPRETTRDRIDRAYREIIQVQKLLKNKKLKKATRKVMVKKIEDNMRLIEGLEHEISRSPLTEFL